MQFLVQISVRLPETMGGEQLESLRAAELERGRALRNAGSIQSIWRVPGGLRNVGIWDAPDATALHELLASLPMFPYLEVDVTPLATHPIEDPSK